MSAVRCGTLPPPDDPRRRTRHPVVTQQGPMTEPQRTRLFRQLESYSEGLARQDCVPSPGMQCSMCGIAFAVADAARQFKATEADEV